MEAAAIQSEGCEKSTTPGTRYGLDLDAKKEDMTGRDD